MRDNAVDQRARAGRDDIAVPVDADVAGAEGDGVDAVVERGDIARAGDAEVAVAIGAGADAAEGGAGDVAGDIDADVAVAGRGPKD